MKKALISTIAIFAFLALAGCQGAEQPVQPGAVPPTESDTQATETVTTQPGETQPVEGEIATQPEPETLTPPTEPSINITKDDLVLMDGALKLRDESYCDKIADETVQSICKQDIKDQAVIDSATAALDPSVCDQLEETKQEICKMEVAVTQQSADDFREPTDEENEIMRRAEESRDVSICDEIESQRKKENCQVNVQALIDMAAQ